MSLSQRLDLTQSQQLRLTPQLAQAIALLQLSATDLHDRVAEEVDRNPILEMERPRPASGPSMMSGGEDFDRAASIAEQVTLRGHLLSQIGGMRARAAVRAVAELIVDELSPDGRLPVGLDELTRRYDLRPGQAAAGLALVQACDPTGVGARSLGECFALQLDDRGLLDPPFRTLCENLARLTRGDRAGLIAATGLAPEALDERLAILRTLDPQPGFAYSAEATAPIVAPDVLVTKAKDVWRITLNPDTLPRVLVNETYAAEVAATGEDAARFVATCRLNASWLTRALEQRAGTVLKVSRAILRHQTAFFETGDIALRPLSMATLAAEVGIHESTVSRAVANKYMATPHGLRPLRGFFAQGVPDTTQKSGYAPAAVQARLRRLIEGEDPGRPLSDDALVRALTEDGVRIARRTVAKYRDLMGIPSSMQRRRLAARPGR
ncbi:RNA polymerase factor sigma-54 [Roseobacter sp. HKCCA0434]|uniref:RNA polymerase factor sigma-54 n=1 Tax=Roseobacter sp. HKCCA0434 TaxID=3079297 RepID=UPI002905CA7A|nr:RNA polymerase factor sigma-54 [Roseobacter sp. HKCCA0434]